jgi:hypothetical protein
MGKWNGNLRILVGLVFCVVLSAPGFAQEMSPREACVQNFGYLGCDAEGMPIPPQANNPQYVVHWAAVAISRSTMKAGASHGQNSQEEAEQTALGICRRNGPTDCRVLTWASNGCVALALGSPSGKFGYGPATNRREAAAVAMRQCRAGGGTNCVVITASCAQDDPRWSAPLPLPEGVSASPVDSRFVGTWQLLINPGYWIWRISANGTYEFHSEAMDGARTHAGTFTASNGQYKLHAINLTWDDAGTYTFQGPDTILGKGKLGSGTWHRMVPKGGH